MNRSEPQPRRKRRRRRSWPRTILLIVFVLAILAGIYACLVRKPQLRPDPSASASQNVSSSSAASSEPAPVKERKDDFFTILVSGTDDGNGCADTNILVGFDAKNQAITCVSIPRDTGVYIDGKSQKVNAAYGKGGMTLLADTVSDALGIPVDFTVEVSLKAFVKLVDEIGGVDFYVPLDMNYDDPYEDLHIHFSKGTQQAFLKTVFQKMLANPQKITGYVKICSEYVKTDLSVSELAWFGEQAILMGLDKLSFATLPGEWSGRLNRWVIDPEAALTLINSGLNPCVADRTLDDLHLVG